MADYTQVDLYEGARWDPIMTYTFNDVAQDITGYTFAAHFLDKKGGTKLLSIVPSIVVAADGTFQPSVTKAQVDAFRSATRPTWFELYVVVGVGVDPYKWMDLPCLYHVGGQ